MLKETAILIESIVQSYRRSLIYSESFCFEIEDLLLLAVLEEEPVLVLKIWFIEVLRLFLFMRDMKIGAILLL